MWQYLDWYLLIPTYTEDKKVMAFISSTTLKAKRGWEKDTMSLSVLYYCSAMYQSLSFAALRPRSSKALLIILNWIYYVVEKKEEIKISHVSLKRDELGEYLGVFL